VGYLELSIIIKQSITGATDIHGIARWKLIYFDTRLHHVNTRIGMSENGLFSIVALTDNATLV